MPKWIAALRNGVVRLGKLLWLVFRVATGVPLAIMVITPAVALTILGSEYVFVVPNFPPDRVLQTALVGYGVLVSLAALCFTAASAVDKSTTFYTSFFWTGILLFQATVYLVLAGVMQYAKTNFLTDMSFMPLSPAVGPPPVLELAQSPVGTVLGVIYTGGVWILFILGGSAVMVAFISLYIFLLRGSFGFWRQEDIEQTDPER